MKIRSRDNRWTVEVVRYADKPGEWLRVKDRNIYVGLVSSPEELAEFGIDLKECEEI